MSPSLGKILVLMGGTSAEREVSLNSGQAVYQALKAKGHNVDALDINENAIQQLANQTFDVAFIALHGRGGEDGSMQGVLDWMAKPYTGSGVMASAIAMDKWRTKLLWQAAGLPTPKAVLLEDTTDWSSTIDALSHNAIVKPAREGSSIGMRRVNNADELAASYQFAKQYDALVLAEKWVQGREFTVAVVQGKALPVIQLKTDRDFYDFEAKYQSNDTQYLLPSGLSESAEIQIKQLAEKAFQLLGCEGWARIDVMEDEAGQFWLLEANTSPGMTDHSLVPMAAQAQGLAFAELVEQLLIDAVARHGD